jgi:hypothetical protein
VTIFLYETFLLPEVSTIAKPVAKIGLIHAWIAVEAFWSSIKSHNKAKMIMK